MKHLIPILFALLPAAAQQEPAKATVKKVIPVQYADPRDLAKLLNIFGCCVEPNYGLKALSVSLPESVMPAVEDVIRRFDVPAAASRNMEITAWFLLGSQKEAAEGVAVPADMEPVAKQIRAALHFNNLRLLDTLVLRTGSGVSAEASGALSAASAPVLTRFRIGSATVTADGKSVRIDGLRVGLRNPVPGANGPTYVDTGINTTGIDIAEGQKVVVGKYSMASMERSLIVVLSAKLL
jgi:hypothetical protein